MSYLQLYLHVLCIESIPTDTSVGEHDLCTVECSEVTEAFTEIEMNTSTEIQFHSEYYVCDVKLQLISLQSKFSMSNRNIEVKKLVLRDIFIIYYNVFFEVSYA